MKALFKITEGLLEKTIKDLKRPHPFAAERVGFFLSRVAALGLDTLLILAHSFHPVADEDYLDEPWAGATMGPAAIRKALQIAYNQHAAMFHVHMHEHHGKPSFSNVDSRESARFVPNFWNVEPYLPHGAIVLSKDSMAGRCWIPDLGIPFDISRFTVVGIPVRQT